MTLGSQVMQVRLGFEVCGALAVAMIIPVVQVNLRNIVRGAQALFPPAKSTLEHYYKQGYKDAWKWLKENELLERKEGSSV